jgi:hypothetical protein
MSRFTKKSVGRVETFRPLHYGVINAREAIWVMGYKIKKYLFGILFVFVFYLCVVLGIDGLQAQQNNMTPSVGSEFSPSLDFNGYVLGQKISKTELFLGFYQYGGPECYRRRFNGKMFFGSAKLSEYLYGIYNQKLVVVLMIAKNENREKLQKEALRLYGPDFRTVVSGDSFVWQWKIKDVEIDLFNQQEYRDMTIAYFHIPDKELISTFYGWEHLWE